VFTALDRPLAKTKYQPLFFGRASHLPVHYISLAIKAEVRVIVAASVWMPDRRYHFLISEPIYLTRYPDRQTELIKNAEAVLQVAESYIRQYPEQWSMFFPVWPAALNEV
jgi:lauroyl/myristoyl acyltransferase